MDSRKSNAGVGTHTIYAVRGSRHTIILFYTMRQATIFIVVLWALLAIASCHEDSSSSGKCAAEEEHAHQLERYDRYTSERCMNTMTWMQGKHFPINECTYHWVITQDTQGQPTGTIQMGVEGRNPDGYVVLSDYRIPLRGGTNEVKREDLAIVYNEAMQICFFLDSEFDHVGCPVRILLGHQRSDLMIIETLSTFPPPQGWGDMLLDVLIHWMESLVDSVRSYRSDVTVIM